MFDFTKQVSEKYDITLDFTDVLATAEIITVKSVIAWLGIVDKSADVITSSAIDITAKKIVILVKAGTDRNSYKITTIATTSLANVFEEDILMDINNI